MLTILISGARGVEKAPRKHVAFALSQVLEDWAAQWTPAGPQMMNSVFEEHTQTERA